MSDEENYDGVVAPDDFDAAAVGDDNVDDAPEPEGEEGSGSTYTQYARGRGGGGREWGHVVAAPLPPCMGALGDALAWVGAWGGRGWRGMGGGGEGGGFPRGSRLPSCRVWLAVRLVGGSSGWPWGVAAVGRASNSLFG